MKYFTFLALLGLANINATDFDGDGIEDKPANTTCTGTDCWYEAEEVQESKLTWRDYANKKEFIMLAAGIANQTADADGNDELGVFKVELYKDNNYVKDLFNKDLNDASTNDDFGTYQNGWRKDFTTPGNEAVADFEWNENSESECYLKMSMEELDGSAEEYKSTCEVKLPCTNSPFAYAPCWIKGTDANGDYDNTGAGEFRHGFYMMTYKVRNKFNMEDWGTCDIQRNCRFRMFGRGFFCRKQ